MISAVKQVNSAFCELFQTTPTFLSGKALIALYPPVQEMYIYKVIKEVSQSGKPFHQSTSLYADERVQFWFESHISRLPNNELLVVINDQTAEVEAKNAITAERDRAQQFFDIAGTILIVLDTHGDIMAINEKGAQVVGSTQEELIGQNWFRRFVHSMDRKRIDPKFYELIEGNVAENQKAENRIITVNGEIRTIAWTNSILKDADGVVFGTLSSGEDVTEQRKMIHELRLINKVIEKSLNAFHITDDDGKFIFVNQAFVDLWGYGSAEEIIGTNCELYCVAPTVPGKVGAILEHQGEYLFEVDAKHKNGSVFTVLMYSRA